MSGPKVIGPARFCPHFGGGRVIRPSRCMSSIVTLAIMSLSPPSALNQPMRWQNSFDRRWRFSGGRPAMSARSSAISSTVKLRPVIAALDLACHPGAIRVRLRSSLIDQGSHDDMSSGGRPPLAAQAPSHA